MSKKVPDPFTLVIFGASGDLTHRKLVPAVYGLFVDGLLPETFSLVGCARTRQDRETFLDSLRASLRQSSRGDAYDETTWRAFASRVRYCAGSYDVEGLRTLKAELDGAGLAAGNVLYDLATPPVVFAPVAEALRDLGLVHDDRPDGPWSRIIVEKPFGRDLDSARDLNRTLRSAFSENQIFRIDHYLGKETVQNILVLRFANAIFEPIWNQKYVDHVQITVSESMGVEGRGGYYDRAGALRDILQNHMMHLLCLVAMEPPVALEADAVRDEKVKLLRALRTIPCECFGENVVRAQYAAGTSKGQPVSGYLSEEGVAPGSSTETFVALKTFVDNWRWEGVPFYLRTGKRLAARVTDVSIHFKPIPRVLFGAAGHGQLEPNQLGIRIQPDERISLKFQVKVPGPAMEVRPHRMDFGYAEAFGREPPDAYERLLLDAALGDATLFIRDDEVLAAWSFVNPLLEACEREQGRRLPTYRAGSWGPVEADRLIETDGRKWEMMRNPQTETRNPSRGKNHD
ncbi:MAG TPA: glucose-6-phosphate dehydrogenase [Planctomycetota bacterium]|nr:glucose-6-phosphate dehydrogenase [Planctomycetota bacterium]